MSGRPGHSTPPGGLGLSGAQIEAYYVGLRVPPSSATWFIVLVVAPSFRNHVYQKSTEYLGAWRNPLCFERIPVYQVLSASVHVGLSTVRS